MTRAAFLIARPDPSRPMKNHRSDLALAEQQAQSPPCWVVLVGVVPPASGTKKRQANTIRERDARHKEMRRALGLPGDKVANGGVSVFAPVKLFGTANLGGLATELSRYLIDHGLRMALRQSPNVDVRLAADMAPILLAAVVEAVSVYPGVDVWVGDDHLNSSLRWPLRRDLFRAPPPRSSDSALIGASPAIDKVRRKIDLYADQPYPVLLIGETGTGKELVAKMLHTRSGREGRFMPQNAAQLPPELADSLLFGHRKGAFTGADVDRPGRIREAEGGTFFLDETFNLAPSVQGKLLRALNRVNEGIILVESVGSTKEDVVRARLVVSALSDPRLGATANGGSAMRLDLFYRVSVGIIRLPPLRQTLDDLPALCRGLLGRLDRPVEVTDSGISVLRGYGWPGNIRELNLILLRSLMNAPRGVTRLDADHISTALKTNQLPPGAAALPIPCDLDQELKRIEVATLRAALRDAGQSPTRAGRRIGMSRKNARNFTRRLDQAERRLRALSGSEGAEPPVEQPMPSTTITNPEDFR